MKRQKPSQMTIPCRIANTAALSLALTLAACSKDDTGSTAETGPSAPGATTAADAALGSIVLSEAPGEAVGIVAARASSRPGDTVIVKGFVGGRLEPFVSGRAVLVLGDRNKLTPCNDIPGDECETPWDVCCDAPEDIAAATATVQVVDESGAVVKGDLKGLSGIRELSNLVVTGTVDQSSTPESLIVNATGIFVQR